MNILSVSFFPTEDVKYWTRDSSLYSPVEYRPIWLQQYRKKLPPTEKVSIARGVGSFDITEWKAHERTLFTNGDTDLTLQLSTFYFPGWTAEIDGNNYNIKVEKDSGSMLLEVPKGRHEVRLIFKDTQVRRSGKIISMITLFSMLIFLAYALINRSKYKKTTEQLETS